MTGGSSSYPNIRFVVQQSPGAASGPPDPRRHRRVSRACSSCHSRKTRCSGTQPCESCVSSKRTCVFEPVAKRGEPKKGRSSLGLTSPANPLEHQSSTSLQQRPSAALPHTPHSGGDTPSAPSGKVHNQPQAPPDSSTCPTSSSKAPPGTDVPVSSRPSDMQQPHPFRYPFFRYLGATAIAPGKPFRRVSVGLQRRKIKRKRASSSASNVATSTGRSPKNFSGSSAFPQSPSRPSPARAFTDFTPLEPSLSHPQGYAVSAIRTAQSEPTSSTYTSRSPSPPFSGLSIPESLLDTFYDHLSSFLPYYRRSDLSNQIENGTASEILLNIVASMAERINPTSGNVNYAEVFASRAKTLVIPHLALPNIDTVFALLLIAYHEFGEDRDSGLWMWCGLAIRMAMDMGLHKYFLMSEQPREEVDTLRQRVFWSVFQLDRLISSGTGRVSTITEDEIMVPPPSAIPSDLLSKTAPEDGVVEDNSFPHPFPYLCRVLILLGRIGDFFNRGQRASWWWTHSVELAASVSPNRTTQSLPQDASMANLQRALTEFHYHLPPPLMFNVTNFQLYAKRKQSQGFLLLHIWFHALVLATHHPSLFQFCMVGDSSADPTAAVSPESIEICRSSSRSISDMIAFAELIDPSAFTTSPFASQPIFMAACAALMELNAINTGNSHHEANQSPTDTNNLTPSTKEEGSSSYGSTSGQSQHVPAGSTLLGLAAHRSFSICQEALSKMRKTWKGCSWLCATLESRAADEPDVDLTEENAANVSTRDAGYFNRIARLSADQSLPGGTDLFGLSVAGTGDESKELHLLRMGGHETNDAQISKVKSGQSERRSSGGKRPANSQEIDAPDVANVNVSPQDSKTAALSQGAPITSSQQTEPFKRRKSASFYPEMGHYSNSTLSENASQGTSQPVPSHSYPAAEAHPSYAYGTDTVSYSHASMMPSFGEMNTVDGLNENYHRMDHNLSAVSANSLQGSDLYISDMNNPKIDVNKTTSAFPGSSSVNTSDFVTETLSYQNTSSLFSAIPPNAAQLWGFEEEGADNTMSSAYNEQFVNDYLGLQFSGATLTPR